MLHILFLMLHRSGTILLYMKSPLSSHRYFCHTINSKIFTEPRLHCDDWPTHRYSRLSFKEPTILVSGWL